MKLSQFDTNAAQLSGITANNFQIQMNAKMFSILTDKLYKDKPGAVIRELSCNAWDAHVEAGNPQRPFEIALPTWLQKNFAIRDYGTGIPHAEFEEIYTNVGQSTKEDSNEVVGAFGLGSKTPFALTDTFLVENWNAGFKSTWVCFKSAGYPQVSQLSIVPNDEPSGIKVSFDFNSDSVRGFQRAILKQLSFFPVKPLITGGDRDDWADRWPVVPDYTGKQYFYYETNELTSDGVLLMGPVSYPFEKEDLGISRYGDSRGKLFNKPLCIVAELGDVDVPPSRETLEFTDKTKNYILGIVDSIKADYRKEFEADLLTKETLREAWEYVEAANTTLVSYGIDDLLCIGTQGKEFAWQTLNSNFYNIPEYSLFKGRSDLKSKIGSTDSYFSARVLRDPDTVFYINDLGTKGAAHITESYTKFASLRETYFVKTGLKATAKPEEHKVAAEEAIKVLKDNHAITATLLSDFIGFPVIQPKVKGTRTAVPVDQVFTAVTNLGPVESLKTYKGPCVTSGLPDTGYFVEIHGATFKDNLWENYRRVKVCLWYLQSRGTDGVPKAPVYLVRSKTVSKLDPTKCQPLTSLYPEVILYITEQRALRARKQESLKMLPIPLLSLLTEFPVLKEANDKETEALLRYWRRTEATVIDRTIPAPEYTRSLYNHNAPMTPALTPPPSKLKEMKDRTEAKYKDILRFHSEFMGYRGTETDFKAGMAHLVKVISSKLVSSNHNQ